MMSPDETIEQIELLGWETNLSNDAGNDGYKYVAFAKREQIALSFHANTILESVEGLFRLTRTLSKI